MIEALINSNNKINVMQPSYMQKLGFYVQKTNISAQKIDGNKLKIFKMVIAFFQ